MIDELRDRIAEALRRETDNGGSRTEDYAQAVIEELEAEFDRFIARIKAEAWDEGWFTAADEARGDVWFPAWGRQTNPYREEAGL